MSQEPLKDGELGVEGKDQEVGFTPPPQYPYDLEGDVKMIGITPFVTHVICTSPDVPDKHDDNNLLLF